MEGGKSAWTVSVVCLMNIYYAQCPALLRGETQNILHAFGNVPNSHSTFSISILD